MNGLGLEAYREHAFLRIFNGMYERWIAQSIFCLVAFLPVECGAEWNRGCNALDVKEESFYGYLSSAVPEAYECISLKPFNGRKKRK